jgi:8-hydroxy-5-deazaflavin:NADPH oxidoreductase
VVKGRSGPGSSAEAVAFGEVVLFAIPGAAMEAAIAENAAALDGKIVIDAANKMGAPVANSLAAFSVHAPKALVFRAFNALGWENFEDPFYNGVPADLFFSGPDGGARQQVERLIAEVGLRPVYAGGPEQADVVDGLLRLWINLVRGRNMGRGIAFKLLQRG